MHVAVTDCFSLIVGIGCAAVGGELFVRGAVGLALWVRISPAVIGATVGAFATSSPELSVAVNSAIAGKPQISLGDVLGSNVVNTALILGLVLLVSGIRCPRESVKRDFPVAIFIPIVTGLLLLDGMISRIDGIIMLAMFAAWFAFVIVEAREQRKASVSKTGKRNPWLVICACVFGLGLLMAAGNLIVAGAKGIALSFGISEFTIGATIVAIGTSVPELATAIVSKLRCHDEIGLGTILGSNIFNGLFIVTVAAVICPIKVVPRDVLVALECGLLAIVFTYPGRGGLIRRSRGVLLLALYAAYLGAILLRLSV
jgi:cation:H+ antiporter